MLRAGGCGAGRPLPTSPTQTPRRTGVGHGTPAPRRWRAWEGGRSRGNTSAPVSSATRIQGLAVGERTTELSQQLLPVPGSASKHTGWAHTHVRRIAGDCGPTRDPRPDLASASAPIILSHAPGLGLGIRVRAAARIALTDSDADSVREAKMRASDLVKPESESVRSEIQVTGKFRVADSELPSGRPPSAAPDSQEPALALRLGPRRLAASTLTRIPGPAVRLTVTDSDAELVRLGG